MADNKGGTVGFRSTDQNPASQGKSAPNNVATGSGSRPNAASKFSTPSSAPRDPQKLRG